MRVELINDSSSPYTVRSESGFEFYVGAEDFRTFYQEEGTPIPKRWAAFITDPELGLCESGKMVEVIQTVRRFESRTRDYDDARAMARAAIRIVRADRNISRSEFSRKLALEGYPPDEVTQADFNAIKGLSEEIAELIESETCAEIPLFDWETELDPPDEALGPEVEKAPSVLGDARPSVKEAKAKAGAVKRGGMKNVELEVEGDTLTVRADLSKDFGPSKSGRTIIVASTSGNKGLPGREEKIGLNIYRSAGAKPIKGRKKEFKNVLMSVEGDQLTLTIDLSAELGPSKSGQTILVASTGGNQLVFGREEKIGLNVYRPAPTL
jgi:hypothetical protein